MERDDRRFKRRKVAEADFVGFGEKITEETLPGMTFKLGGRITMTFHEDGEMSANGGLIKGTWEMHGSLLSIENPIQKRMQRNRCRRKGQLAVKFEFPGRCHLLF